MAEEDSFSSDSDTDDIDSCIWSLKKRQSLKQKDSERVNAFNQISNSLETHSVLEKYKKFEELKRKSDGIRSYSAKRQLIAEKRRAKRLVKKALRDPFIKDLVEKSHNPEENDEVREKEAKEWKTVKPFLNVNSHLQTAVSHGDWGPKTELECTIDDAIKKGDFEKAELLSDTLANREFATKITKAFSAKRCHEKLEKQKLLDKDKKAKKIRWTFDAKERWQMKGNM